MITQSLPEPAPALELPLSFRPAIELAVYSHDQLRAVPGLEGLVTLSFDATAVEATARMHGIEITPQAARDLFVLQKRGLAVMGENQ